MNEAVIVSTARTPIGKAYKGAFNNTLQTSSGIMNIVSGSNTTFISLNSSILFGKSKAKGENTYVSGENFDITLSNTNISLGLNDF